jgi:23S rRNA (uracil1939-C5)-methyltransferase
MVRRVLDAERIAAGGDAIAHDEDGRVVFVTGALPGERVAVEITTRRRDYSFARVLEVLDPSPHRTSVPCAAVGAGCGACQWQHVSIDAQRELKRDIVVDALRRIGRLEDAPVDPVVALEPWHYRTTVRAAVVDGRAGYRRFAGHDVVTVEDCAVAHPLVEDLLLHGRFPGVREVVLRCGARTGERLVAPLPGRARPIVPDDVRFDHLHEEAAGRRWRISAHSFFQARPDGADALADLVLAAAGALGDAGAVVDLYSGVGLFAGTLAAAGWRVTAVEGQPSAVADAQVNLDDLGAAVVHSNVDDWPPSPADLVVADPSRAGLGKDGVATVVACEPRRIVLISCDPAALGRDTHLLAAHGYRMTSATPVDLFPQTFHIETVAVLDREVP